MGVPKFLWLILIVSSPDIVVVSVNSQTTTVDSMPPRHLASISVHDNPDPSSIIWGEPYGGLAVGIARVRATVYSPMYPVIDAYLENRIVVVGKVGVALNGVNLTPGMFKLELDGKIYSTNYWGGPESALAPGERSRAVTIDSMQFHQVEKLATLTPVDEAAPRPVLSTGEHSLRLYVNWKGWLVAGPVVKFTVSLGPYPLEDALLQIERDLHDSDSFLRARAATSAGELRLAGARVAIAEALRDGNNSVRNASARALGSIGDRVTVSALKSVLNDSDMDVRVSAIQSLVNLGERLDVAWAEPIIRSKAGNAFQNAIWLVRRYGGQASASTLIRCLDMSDPSVKSYYNYTHVWQIGACGGPHLTYYHDFDGIGTPDRIENNRNVLTAMQAWLSNHEKTKK